MSKSRVFAIGALTGLVVGVGATAAWFAWPPVLSDRAMRAQAGCKNLALAIEAFVWNPSSAAARFPTDLGELVKPPFGGPSFLRHGTADLTDPWGQPYQMAVRKGPGPDGREYGFVTTFMPDGTPISQFGIGRASVPPR